MASNGTQQSYYACKCLNVRLHSHPPPAAPSGSAPPGPPADDPYISVHVGDDDGIDVAHTRVTLRTRSKPLEQKNGESSQWTRYSSLTCLICQTLAYRVHQVISPDIDSTEGPVLPTDEWAEQEVLRSTTGWIEVHKNCLSGDAIAQAELSPLYSPVFRIVLPSRIISPEDASPASPPRPSAPGSPPLGTHHLPALPALFLPPPFTPAHPVFSYLSQVALNESKKLRDAAEEYITRIVEERTKEVLAAESRLKNEVEVLWIQFGESVEAAERSGVSTSTASRRRQSSARKPGSTSPAPGVGGFATSTSVRIHDFVPSAIPPPRASSRSTPRHVTSALSTSLAESSFHYPHAAHVFTEASTSSNNVSGPGRSHVDSSRPLSPTRANTGLPHSPSTSSSGTLAMLTNANGEIGTIRDAYRRNMDQSIDVATSFRYFELEAHMKQQQQQPPTSDAAPPEQEHADDSSLKLTDGISESAIARGRSPKVNKSAIKKPKEQAPASGSPSKKARSSSTGDGSSPKSKRKVTFVVKPDVTIINREVNAEAQDQTDVLKDEEAMFDMETETGARDEGVNNEAIPPVVERPQVPQRPVNGRKKNTAGLPASLSSLRPASLPNMSRIRSPPPPAETAPRIVAAEAEATNGSKVNGVATNGTKKDEEELDPREAELLRLVAASAPSHRAAWKKDSRAWQLFISRQGQKGAGQSILEEDEEEDTSTAGSSKDYPDDSDVDDEMNDVQVSRSKRGGQWSYYESPIASSLPIPINFKSRAGRSLGVPSYQPKTSLSDRPGLLVPPLKASADALRKASYAERDLSRELDPGALDFDLEDVEEEDENEVNASSEVGSTGRQRALKIIQAREAIPAAGMWRSLA